MGFLLTILALVVVTVGMAVAMARWLVPPVIRFDTRPDAPAAFGYRMAWLAVRTRDAGKLAQVLGLEPGHAANWRTGIGTVYDGRLGEAFVYITPPVDGWTFVVGLALPQPMGRGFVDKCTPMLLDLGQNFREAHYFMSYPPLEFCSWIRVMDGRLIRAFAIGDEGVIWNKGRLTREERSLDLDLLDPRKWKVLRDEGLQEIERPTEEHLMVIAQGWSVNPTTLGTANAPHHVEPGPGFVCEAPLGWRPQRLRRTG